MSTTKPLLTTVAADVVISTPPAASSVVSSGSSKNGSYSSPGTIGRGPESTLARTWSPIELVRGRCLRI